MVKIFLTTFAFSLLSACTTLDQWLANGPFAGTGVGAEHSKFSFDWQLNGDKRIAPFQVFDNGQQTWLQFQPGQNIPAIFELTDAGEKPLIYQRKGEYLVLDGVWPQLGFRGGSLSATATRAVSPDLKELGQAQVLLSGVDVADDVAVATAPVLMEESTAEFISSSFDLISEPSFDFAITIADQNLRKALQRWAKRAQWTFEPEHWNVDVDIPVSANASFDGDFKGAVQNLIAATELADRPLQPCFYSNRVLRIVPYAQACDRTSRSALL